MKCGGFCSFNTKGALISKVILSCLDVKEATEKKIEAGKVLLQLGIEIHLLIESAGTTSSEGAVHVTFKIGTPENAEIGTGIWNTFQG